MQFGNLGMPASNTYYLAQDRKLLAPLLGAVLVGLTGKWPNLRESCSFLAAAVMFVLVLSLIPDVLAGKKLIYPLFKILPGISVRLRADFFSMIFAVVASFLWIVTVVAFFVATGYFLFLPRRLAHSQNFSPQHLSQFSDRL